MVLYEIATRSEPFAGRDSKTIFALFSGCIQGAKPYTYSISNKMFAHLIEWCWTEILMNRPSAEEVLNFIEVHENDETCSALGKQVTHVIPLNLLFAVLQLQSIYAHQVEYSFWLNKTPLTIMEREFKTNDKLVQSMSYCYTSRYPELNVGYCNKTCLKHDMKISSNVVHKDFLNRSFSAIQFYWNICKLVFNIYNKSV